MTSVGENCAEQGLSTGTRSRSLGTMSRSVYEVHKLTCQGRGKAERASFPNPSPCSSTGLGTQHLTPPPLLPATKGGSVGCC